MAAGDAWCGAEALPDQAGGRRRGKAVTGSSRVMNGGALPGSSSSPSNPPLPPVPPQAAACSDSNVTDRAARDPQPPFQAICRLRQTFSCAQTSEVRECTSLQPLILLPDGLFSFNHFLKAEFSEFPTHKNVYAGISKLIVVTSLSYI